MTGSENFGHDSEKLTELLPAKAGSSSVHLSDRRSQTIQRGFPEKSAISSVRIIELGAMVLAFSAWAASPISIMSAPPSLSRAGAL